MSNPLVYINEHPKDSLRLIGISYEQLQNLIKQAEIRHTEFQNSREASKIRIIAKGGGKKPLLSISEQIVLTMMYLRQHPTFQVLGMMFDVSESTANDTFHYWLSILQDLLPESLFSQLKNSKDDWDIEQELLATQELLVDSSEQDRERPLDNKEQEKYFSGYKKTLI